MAMNNRKELMVLALTLASAVAAVSVGGHWKRSVAFFAAWLVPGAGHVLLGRWKKGLFFFALLGATYVFGMWIAGFHPVAFDDNPFYFFGQYGSGATFLIAKLRGAEKAIVRPQIHPSWFDPGLLYVCVVGLLNLVVMLNILELSVAPAASSGGTATAPAAADKPSVAAPPPAPETPT